MAPQNTLMTANAFTAAYGNIHAELVKGVVKEYPPIWPKQGFICMRIAYFLQAHVKEHDLGRVASNDTWIQTSHNPDTVLGADVCFFVSSQ